MDVYTLKRASIIAATTNSIIAYVVGSVFLSFGSFGSSGGMFWGSNLGLLMGIFYSAISLMFSGYIVNSSVFKQKGIYPYRAKALLLLVFIFLGWVFASFVSLLIGWILPVPSWLVLAPVLILSLKISVSAFCKITNSAF